MKGIVFSSIFILGFINFLAASFYLNQTSVINLVSIAVACFLAVIVYIFKFNLLKSNLTTFCFVVLCNFMIIGTMISVHYIPFTKKLLFTDSKKFIQQQNEYERLLR